MPEELVETPQPDNTLGQDQELTEEVVGEEIVEPFETQEDKTWKGRLTKEQEERKLERDRIDAQLRAGGYCLDAAGNIIALQQQPQYQQPVPVQTTVPQSEYVPEDLYDEEKAPSYIKNLARQEAMSIISQIVPELVSMFDEVRVPEYEDWNDIGADVVSSLKELGFAGVTHAKKINPRALEFCVNAARGKRIGAGNSPVASPRNDLERTEAIAAATSPGDSTADSGNSLGSYNLSVEEREWMKANNMNEKQYLDFIANPATIGRKK